MTPFIADLKRLALAATPGAGWTCWRCEQRNAGWTTTCGRCELDRITPERILAMIAVIEAAKAWRDSDIAEDERALTFNLVAAIDALDKEQK